MCRILLAIGLSVMAGGCQLGSTHFNMSSNSGGPWFSFNLLPDWPEREKLNPGYHFRSQSMEPDIGTMECDLKAFDAASHVQAPLRLSPRADLSKP